jgi:hypothetical protein
LLVVVCLHLGGAAVANELAVPATFIRDIKIPGLGETILRPTSVHFDKQHDEVLVADSGNNRIVIFGGNGVYKFDFFLTEIMTAPRDITTDPEGFIFVLGSDPAGQVVYRFDYDGTPLGPVAFPLEHEGVGVELRDLVCDDEGTLYALDHLGRRILVLGGEGAVDLVIHLERDSDVRAQLIEGAIPNDGAFALGSLTCADGVLYIPVSNVGTVMRFATDGRYLGSLGSFGAKTGFLNFPVAVEVSPEGLIMVLDKPRYCIPCYSPDGKFLGEFGGKGISPGWFMGPSLLSVTAADRVIVGQIFRNKIQVCAIPEFIRAKLDREPSGPELEGEEISSAPAESGRLFVNTQRRLSENSRPVGSHDEEFPSSLSNNAHVAQNVSLPEVSE